MRYYFIINPKSGKKKHQKKIFESLDAAASKLGINYEVYQTKASSDATGYVKELCKTYEGSGESLRIYACGGDGTLNEVVNGAIGYDNVEIGAIPLGTGNDYIRNYGRIEDFFDMEAQLAGSSVYSDVIKYTAWYNEEVTRGYCVNMFNIGFDCNVVDMTSKVKAWPLVYGPMAYLISVAIILIRKQGADLHIEYEDGYIKSGKILLLAIANGCFCGGGVKGVPYCKLDDGLMDVSVINNVTRRLFIRLFPSYAKGVHLEKKKVRRSGIIRYTKEKVLTVTANGKNMRLCTDGEITTQKKVKFSMLPRAFKFIVPSVAAV